MLLEWTSSRHIRLKPTMSRMMYSISDTSDSHRMPATRPASWSPELFPYRYRDREVPPPIPVPYGYRRVHHDHMTHLLHRGHHKHYGVTLRSLTVRGGKSEWETCHLRPTCVQTNSEKHGCSRLTRRIQMYYYNYRLKIIYKYKLIVSG